MRIDGESLKSMLKLVADNTEIDVSVAPSQSAYVFKFTDKGGKDVTVTVYDSELSIFPTITYTERLPR